MRGEAPIAPPRGFRAQAQQFGEGRIGRMRRKTRMTTPHFQRRDPIGGLLQNGARLAAARNADHFQERKHAQGCCLPRFRQQFGHSFDIGHAGGAGPDQHLRSIQP